MVAPEREIVDLTAVIRGILDNYPAGSAVLREFLQNSDDCGAHSQDFILDTRSFSGESLVDSSLAYCQGPALFAINDGHFQEKDWKALKHIHNSSKTADETSTGKYGLGFRSCYHITDNPHILSDKKLLVLDPHNRVAQYPGGFSLSLDSNDRHQYRGHFLTFGSVLNDNDQVYNGTAIRLPLRLKGQAEISGIKNVATSVEAIRAIFQDFIKKELREVMLFLKNITSIGLFEVGEDGVKRQIARAWVDNADDVAARRSVSRGREEESSAYELRILVNDLGSISSRAWIVAQFVENYGLAEKIVTTRCPDAPTGSMASEKLLPHIALAYPIPDTTMPGLRELGKLFTLLPLPIITGFPVHIHAIFALTSSRQSLRNSLDVATGSREEFLVEWNRAIFLNFIPKAWTILLEYAAQKNGTLTVTPYDLWPKANAGDQADWRGLCQELLTHGAPRPIWPLSNSGGSLTEHHPLNDVLLAPINAKIKLLNILADCGVKISQPPEHVYSLVATSQAHQSRLMTPSSVVNALKSNTPRLSAMSLTSRLTLCEYISTGNDINLLSHVPLVLCADGTWTSIYSHNSYILATETQAGLFDGIDSEAHLLALDRIGKATTNLLLSSPRIQSLQCTHVVNFLELKYSRFRSNIATVSVGVGAADVEWLVRFWNWMGGWQEAPTIWTRMEFRTRSPNLHIIPLSVCGGRHELRLFARASIDPIGLDDELLEVLRELRLPVLHSRVESLRSFILQEGLKRSSDLEYLLFELRGFQSCKLSQSSCRRLHNHFVAHLPALPRQLPANEMTTLRALPIYPVLHAGPRKKDGYTFEAGPISPCFVDDSLEVVPNIRGRPIIAISDYRTIISAAYSGQVVTARESKVLELAIQCWEEQGQDLARLLVPRIINRLGDLSANTLRLVERLPIVDVGFEPSKLRRPAETVDPNSSIAQLFDDGEGVLPQGLFALDGPGSHLRQLRNYGMLLSQLSPEVVTERIERIVGLGTPLHNKDAKANALLNLLDDYCRTHVLPREVADAVTTKSWLLAGSTYCSSSQSWDKRPSDLPLCDQTLPLVNYVVLSPHLRKILGWQIVPFDILKRQLLAVVPEVALPTGPQTERIKILIQALAHRLDMESCTENDLKSLGQTLNDRSPPFEVLYTELAEISLKLVEPSLNGRERKALISASLQVLRELFLRDASDSTVLLDRSRIRIPTTKSLLHPIDSTLFNDMGLDHSSNGQIILAHPDISSGFAATMGLLRLSDRQFDAEYDLLGERQLREDFCGRIRGVLKDYQMESASNEWVANADDAGATKVGFMVDEATFGRSQNSGFLTPESVDMCQSPALVIWNSATFAAGDYDGLLSAGKGGQGGNHEAIGRFGLGALSFYHFTEMAMLVSGNRVMFLDPSGSHLPRNMRGDHRTALMMSLETCRSKYADHLQPLEGLFEFSQAKEYYEGTLFRLPLRTPKQAVRSKLSNKPLGVVELHTLMETKVYDQAKSSLFFTRVEEISAQRRDPSKTTSRMWSIRGNRTDPGEGVNGGHVQMTEMRLDIRFKTQGIRKQEWLIHFAKKRQSDVPEMFAQLTRNHRLPPPSTGLAMRINRRDSKITTNRPTRSRLFATLPLPIEIALPVHVHATWILAADRRTIRFDAADADEERPMDTRYNLYLLEVLIPEVYLCMLATLARREYQDWYRCWPGGTQEVLQPMIAALYKQFAKTTHHVCRTVTGAVVTPASAIFATSKSPHVRPILEALQLPKLVSPLPFDASLILSWEGLQTDDAGTVAGLMRLETEAVKRLFQTGPQPSRPSVSSEHLDGVIRYLMEGEHELNGLPLLQLGDGSMTTFGDATHPWIFQDVTYPSTNRLTNISIATLFGPSHIVGPAITNRTCKLLISKVGNVRRLDVEGIRRLLSTLMIAPREEASVSETRKAWLRKLLNFLDVCSTPKLRDISDLPLIPVMNGDTAISFNRAGDGTVFTVTSLGDLSIPIIRLGILVVPSLPGLTLEPILDLARLLNAFRSLGHVGGLNQRVSVPEWESLRQWIRRNLIRGGWSQADHQTLLALLIFDAQNGGRLTTPSLHPAGEIHMLPVEVRLAAVARYLPRTMYFADHSFELSLVLEGRSRQVLSVEELVGHFELPAAISADEDRYFQSVFAVVISYWRRGVLSIPFVPDMDRILRKPEELYDHRIRLFALAFGTRHAKFVHDGYRNSMASPVQAGVRTVIDAPTLVQCAMALDEDAREGVLDQARAAEFWNAFGDDNATRNISLDTIANLRFIPSRRQRCGVTEFEEFARPLPDQGIASLNELVRTEYAPVVWTQRAHFATTPPRFIITINPDLGIPTVEEVKHLEVLAVEIAPRFPSNRDLLNDLVKTYDWLLDHIEDARSHLRQRKTNSLWLNVNDPRDGITVWAWRSGSQLILDLRFDDPVGGHYDVKDFLVRYRDLIMAAGAHEQAQLTVPAFEREITHDERIRLGWDYLRREECMTDIHFKLGERTIKAHRGALAATITHFRDVLTGEFQEGEVAISAEAPMMFPMDGITSFFAIKSVVDYAYSEAGLALQDLLALLGLSDMWMIDDLKYQTQRTIVELGLVRMETYEDILHRAEECKATVLVEACQQRQQDVNRWSSAQDF
ncbi:hypothetical protein FRB97_001732 [Tulasnella sp. 331]|nr:hypothetical protein FRB97_001732 [Tulasnella sp. 331]